jgi:hypothetical protein
MSPSRPPLFRGQTGPVAASDARLFDTYPGPGLPPTAATPPGPCPGASGADRKRIETGSQESGQAGAEPGLPACAVRGMYQPKGGFGWATRPLIGGNKVGTAMRPAERMQSLYVPSRMTNGCFVVVG